MFLRNQRNLFAFMACSALNFIEQEFIKNFHFFEIGFWIDQPKSRGDGGKESVAVLRRKAPTGYSQSVIRNSQGLLAENRLIENSSKDRSRRVSRAQILYCCF